MTLHVVDSTDEVFEFLRWLGEQRYVAVDTETTGTDVFARDFGIRLAQVGNTETAWVFDFRRWYGVIDEMFKTYEGRFVFHNARFDVHAFESVGIIVPWHSLDDTMIALRLAEPMLQAGLKPASDRHISQGASGSQADLHKAFRSNSWDWDSVPLDFPTYLMYAGLDVILTSRLYEAPGVQVGFKSPVYDLEMQIRALANKMERGGLGIDRDYSRDQSRKLREEAAELRTVVQDEYGFSPTSTQLLGRWLMTNATHCILKTTESGAPSTDKETLERVAREGDAEARRLAEMVLRVRRTEKLASAYFDNFVELVDEHNHLHADIETLAARTGRMSIRRPGLQTLPRVTDDPETKMVRYAVVPREPDHVLISCDSDQIELRLAAALANDTNMIKAFEESDDFFTTLMREIYDDPDAEKTDPRRAAVKTTMYARTYGAGPAKIALSAGVPEPRIRELLDGFKRSYPLYMTLGERYEREARDNDGWVTNPYGRRLQVEKDRLYTATNYVIQSCAADVLKHSIVALGHAGFDEYMVIPVHDELLLSVPAEDAEEAKHTVSELMTCRDFPLTLTASAGDPAMTWAEAK